MTRHLMQMKEESDRDYHLFCEYYNLGINRCIASFSVDCEISSRTLYRIAKKNKWKERIAKDMEEIVSKRQADFARLHKEKISSQIESMTLSIKKIKELNMAIDVKLDSFARPDRDLKEFYERANLYMTIKLKIQKYERNFYAQLKEFETEEDHELDNLIAEVDAFDNADEDSDSEANESVAETYGHNDSINGTNNIEEIVSDSAKLRHLLPTYQSANGLPITANENDLDIANFDENPFLRHEMKFSPPKSEISSDSEIRMIQERLGVVANP